jgi:DNA polymerase I-like protein with 3'-5' exonuclease and polymerase domains
LLYGAGARTFRSFASANYGLDITLEDAEQYKTQFDKSYAKLRFWQLEQHRKHQQAGEFRTVGGRRCVFKDRKHCYTDSRNYPIQGAAADLQMKAIHAVSDQLTGKGVYLVNMVHDELIMEVVDAQVAHVMDQLVLIMTDVFMQVFRRFPAAKDVVGGLVDVKSGNSYAEAK